MHSVLRAAAETVPWTKDLGDALASLDARLGALGAGVEERVRSDEYLALIRQVFRVWQSSDEDTRRCAINLAVSAAAEPEIGDDVLRLFVHWLEQFGALHLAMIRAFAEQPGATRAAIAQAIYPFGLPAEASAEAKQFMRAFVDLISTGVLHREGTPRPIVVERDASHPAKAVLRPLAFDDREQCSLSVLGRRFMDLVIHEHASHDGVAASRP